MKSKKTYNQSVEPTLLPVGYVGAVLYRIIVNNLTGYAINLRKKHELCRLFFEDSSQKEIALPKTLQPLFPQDSLIWSLLTLPLTTLMNQLLAPDRVVLHKAQRYL